jgi:hypothetical protein
MTPLLKGIHNGQKLLIMNFIINLRKKKLTRTQVDRMNFYFFFKLWEYDVYYKVNSVHL